MREQTRGHKRHIGLYLLFGILLFIVTLRIMLPGLIKTIANNRLEKESPYFSFHINDIDFYPLKGRYAVRGITGVIKQTHEQFLNIGYISCRIPWRNVFQGKVVADVVVDRMNLYASQALLDNGKLEMERLKKEYPPKEAQEDLSEEKKESPFILDSFALVDCYHP